MWNNLSSELISKTSKMRWLQTVVHRGLNGVLTLDIETIHGRSMSS
jgi:hypothetical protein